MKNSLKIVEALKNIKEEDMLVPSYKKYNYPFDFVVDFLCQIVTFIFGYCLYLFIVALFIPTVLT